MTTNQIDYKPAIEFLRSHSQSNTEGERTSQRSDYFAFMEKFGNLTKEDLDKHFESHSLLAMAQSMLAQEDCAALVKTTKAAGEVADGVRSEYSIRTPYGKHQSSVIARKEVQDNIHKNEDGSSKPPETRYGVVSFHIKTDRYIDKKALALSAKIIEEALA